MHELLSDLAEHIASGLRKKSIRTCSQWAEAFRVLGGKDYPGPWRFKHHPWLKGMHDSTARTNVGQKSAQMGYTETVLNRALFGIDIERTDCLYVLPAQTPDAHDFSAARFDPALELSPHIGKMFTAVKNVGHKRAGSTNLYIRGSKSRSGLKSIPVGLLILDELNEMHEENIPLARERQSGQLTKTEWMISTPTSDGFGINEFFNKSTQEHFFFKCPSCSRMTELIYPDCIVLTATELNDPKLADTHYICKECKAMLPHASKVDWLSTGVWVPSSTTWDERGFYINQMYSPTISPKEIAQSVLKAQNNRADEQEFYNSKLGLAHTPDGSRITDNHIVNCIGDHLNEDSQRGLVTMGVDVGKWLHYEICLWTTPNYATNELNIESRSKAIKIGKCLHFHELDALMHEYDVSFCCIDAHPERRKSLEFATRFYGRVRMVFYGRGIMGKSFHVNKDESGIDTGEPTVTVDRTSWLDLSLGRIRAGHIRLPKDCPDEWKQHVKSLVRIMRNDPDGNPVARYEKKTNDHDHYAHAHNYCELALPFAAGQGSNQDMDYPF
jgi:hypothetical protein